MEAGSRFSHNVENRSSSSPFPSYFPFLRRQRQGGIIRGISPHPLIPIRPFSVKFTTLRPSPGPEREISIFVLLPQSLNNATLLLLLLLAKVYFICTGHVRW